MIDLEVTREKAFKDAEVAYDKFDTNGDGAVDFGEVEKLVGNGNAEEGSDAKAKIDAFVKTSIQMEKLKCQKTSGLTFTESYSMMLSGLVSRTVSPLKKQKDSENELHLI